MTTAGANLRINSARLWDSLQEMAQIGPGIAGGNNRQTLTDADSEGRHLFAGCAERWRNVAMVARTVRGCSASTRCPARLTTTV